MKIAVQPTNNFCFGKIYGAREQEKFMTEAQNVSASSTCKRMPLGAVIVSSNDEIVGKGVNTTPPGVLSCRDIGECIRGKYKIPSGTMYDKGCYNIHAEENALLNAGMKQTKGSTLFLFGHTYMCDSCTKRVVNAGIEDVYIQLKKSEPIKHISAKDLLEQINKNFKSDIEFLAKRLV